MDKLTIENKVIEIIKEKLKIDKVDLEDSFNDTLGADSLDKVEIVMALEEEYNIKLPDDDMDQIITVKDTIDYLYKKLEKY